MKILAIGNSFSHDAHMYQKMLADAVGADLEIMNANIGGCTLETHAKNVREGNRSYIIQYNGKEIDESVKCTIDEALAFRKWDYVTVQQVSGLSGVWETYLPYMDVLVDRIRALCPMAKIVIHQTWAYEHGSQHQDFYRYSHDPEVMTNALTDAYERAAAHIGAVGIIPTGKVIQSLRNLPEFDVRAGGVSLHRDGFHLSYDYGRFAAAAVWHVAFGLGDVSKNPAVPDGEDLDTGLLDIIRSTVMREVEPIIK
ncbi:MAG: DUF4886 domain-containing protein [Clostridia bacterium]|nr:DUF4886 domain-containing protein [Clostridia bacterium]